jgi:hypothetical protein
MPQLPLRSLLIFIDETGNEDLSDADVWPGWVRFPRD